MFAAISPQPKEKLLLQPSINKKAAIVHMGNKAQVVSSIIFNVKN